MTNQDSIINNDDEITLSDIWNFLVRQYKTIFTILIVIMSCTLIYALSRPTIYQSKTSIIIGEQLYFSLSQTPSSQPLTQQIETAEEIQYHYSSLAKISPVKKNAHH